MESFLKFFLIAFLVDMADVLGQIEATNFSELISSSASVFLHLHYSSLASQLHLLFHHVVMLLGSTDIYHVSLVSANNSLLDSDGSLALEDFIFINESTEGSARLVNGVHGAVHGDYPRAS